MALCVGIRFGRDYGPFVRERRRNGMIVHRTYTKHNTFQSKMQFITCNEVTSYSETWSTGLCKCGTTHSDSK